MTEIEKKEIKEMGDIMGKATETNLCHKYCFIDTDLDDACSLCRAATALFKAGYRKQSDTVMEIYNKIYDNLPQVCDWRWLQGARWAMQIAEQYGKEEK